LTATLVDSNVVLDIAAEDTEWLDWSSAMLAQAAERGPVVINPIIYGEVSTRYDSIESLRSAPLLQPFLKWIRKQAPDRNFRTVRSKEHPHHGKRRY